jgi:hypothetical protein
LPPLAAVLSKNIILDEYYLLGYYALRRDVYRLLGEAYSPNFLGQRHAINKQTKQTNSLA